MEKLAGKTLITGASGFVGGRLRDALLDAGSEVVTIRRNSSPDPERGRSVVGNYADLGGLTELIENEKPDFVFHVAGAPKGVSYDDFRRANVMPTRNLLHAVKKAHPSVKRFVLVSSLAAYGLSSISRPHTEDFKPQPIEHYGKSKLEAERVLEQEANGVAWTTLRPSGVYGPGDGDYFNLFREVDKGRNVYFGNRERWFSAIYVDDCVRGLVAAARSDKTVGEGYFLCDGVPITWGTFQEAIIKASGKRVRTVNLPSFLVDVAAVGGELLSKFDKKPRLFNRQKAAMGAQDAWTCRHDKAHEHFDYKPEVDIGDGVRLALTWYRQNGWL